MQETPPQKTNQQESTAKTEEDLLREQNELLKQLLLQEQANQQSYWESFKATSKSVYAQTTEGLASISESTGAKIQNFGNYMANGNANA